MCDPLEEIQLLAEAERPNYKDIELVLLKELKNKKNQEYISFRSDLERYYYKYIISLAKKYEFRDSLNTLDDYITQWLIWLYQAFDLYNPKENVKLLTFWTIYITNKMDELYIKTKGISKNDYFRVIKIRKNLEDKYERSIKEISKSDILREIQIVFNTSEEWSNKVYWELYGFLLEGTTYVSLDQSLEDNAETSIDFNDINYDWLKNIVISELEKKDNKKYWIYINKLKEKYWLWTFEDKKEKVPTKRLYDLFEKQFFNEVKNKYQVLQTYI